MLASDWSESRPQSAPPQTLQHKFSFHGEGLSFFTLMLKNMVLTLLTLGVYLGWAKTERRKYLWQNIEVAGHRLRYHGTGKELFMGYLKIAVGYLLLFALPLIVTKLISPAVGVTLQIVMALAVLAILPAAIWGSRRYLLSRTSWRGIRMGLTGSVGPFAKTLIGGYLLTLITLGFYGPVWMNRMHRLFVDNTTLGTQHFQYRGSDKEAFRLGLKGMLLSIVTLGIYSFWYQAQLMRFQLENTWFDGAQGRVELTGGDIFKLTLIQLFGLTFSLGFAFPWILCYSLEYVLTRVRFEGSVDFGRIYQSASTGDATADSLADALDVGLAV